MPTPRITIDQLLSEIQELPSETADETTREVTAQIPTIARRLSDRGDIPDGSDLASIIRDFSFGLDVIRLFTSDSQDAASHRFCAALGCKPSSWARVKRIATSDPDRFAEALVSAGVPEEIWSMIDRTWTIDDVLFERYRFGRGRAIAGQLRGRSLEDAVEAILRESGIPYEARVTFRSRTGTAKCDFAIPSRDLPKIVIETKGFEATGSKLTDVLGDVEKIEKVRDHHMHFFVVTDGRGWFNRQSDLKRLVEFHDKGVIDMIYTSKRLPQLSKDLLHIWESR
jgi:hypothetical protein